ncbi:arylsulfatase [Pseudomonas sp. N040]|uniref:arylsulfatase n=1 Tax=Pseudomonas sp. N040 TaxID=2785325 RepID=UPI0018A29133|nr:arylsulfatase [Pseudomonas sp. N040]MBF7730481.1 arylsulfatase [Pseudomonas sp. N040]MBW7014124.1 arylsulfatase [Pseudomonas sp. N040]
MRIPFAGYTLGLLLALLAGPAAAAQPNIVLLLADDWGFSDVGAFGGEMATPNLDALAGQGMRFSNFHVAASCAPTRSMLLTGVDNHRNGVGNMPETIPQSHQGQPGYLGVLDTNVVTVASLLRDSGYHTYISGKWHLGHEPHNLPPARGFERSVIQADSGSDNWEMKPYLSLKPEVSWYENGERLHSLPEDFYSSTFFVSKAIEQIESNRDSGQPFFSYIAFQANHIPLQAPQQFIDKYKGRYDQGWNALRQQRRDKAIELGLIPPGTPMTEMATTLDWAALSPAEQAYQARRMEVYAAMAEAMDHEVGRLIAYLKETEKYENTVFLFLSDNGAEGSDPYATLSGRLWLDHNYDRSIERLGGKGAYSIIGPSWASAAVAPLNTYKFWAGEGGIRVPLIVAGVPGALANRISPAFTHVTDIAPTLLALAGVQQPDGRYQGRAVEPMIGRNLLPVLRGQADAVYPVDQPVGYELSGNAAIFKGDYKLLRNLPPIGDGQWHLYDIRRDPGEVTDLQQQLPELFQQLIADYADYARANGVLPMPDGYDPIKQVFINAMINVYLPKLKLWGIPAVLLVLAAIYLLRRRRRQR